MILTNTARTATKLVYAGEYAKAVEELGDRWLGVGVEPPQDGASDVDYARLLLVCGVLTQELGEMRLERSQAAAKDLLSKAIRLFGSDPGEHEARFWLGLAYLRCGENREALTMADALIEEMAAESEVVFCAGRLKGLALLNMRDTEGAGKAFASVEVFLPTVSALSRGRFHLNRGLLFRRTGSLADALREYGHAIESFLEAGSIRFEAATLNNMAGVYLDQADYSSAHAAARASLALFQQMNDGCHEAKVWDQIAQIYGREGNFREMEESAARAVSLLSASDHETWLAEALTTHATACAYLGLDRARAGLIEALEICDRQGHPEQASLTTLAMWDTVKHGQHLLGELRDSVGPIERIVYERALEKHKGHVSSAAHELGLGHQAFQRRLESRFPELLPKRLPPRRRRKTLIKLP